MVRAIRNFKRKSKPENNTPAKESKKETSVSVLGCDPHCPYFPKSVSRVVEWTYDEKIPWIKRRVKPKKFVCQYDGSVIRSWDKQPCAKKLDELATDKINSNN